MPGIREQVQNVGPDSQVRSIEEPLARIAAPPICSKGGARLNLRGADQGHTPAVDLTPCMHEAEHATMSVIAEYTGTELSLCVCWHGTGKERYMRHASQN